MKVSNLLSPRTQTPVKNQFKINNGNDVVFQSYESLICAIHYKEKLIEIGQDYRYSNTTSKYFKIFLSDLGFNYLHDEIKKNDGKDFTHGERNIIYK